MKNIFVFFLLFFLPFLLTAQIKKGSPLPGGTVGFNTGKTSSYNFIDNSTTTSKRKEYQLNPSLGLAIRDNFILGLGINYGEEVTNSTNFKIRSSGYGGDI